MPNFVSPLPICVAQILPLTRSLFPSVNVAVAAVATAVSTDVVVGAVWKRRA